jgi:thiamine biosynthesis protein ThiS
METTETIAIVVNGESRQVPGGTSLARLLELLGLPAGRVAVERNQQIVPRAHWSSTPVAAGDRYEIVQFVGGG